MTSGVHAGGYVVPSYRAPDDTSWYHFLHGNVPGHQIDFMYRPEIPQGALSRQHFSHLSRLMKYIEPESTGGYAFAIGNLSRDDTQYEPGHGGVALIFGLRIRGVTDHAGRQDPPFAHGIAAIDREIDYTTLLRASLAFSRHVLGAAESAEWYRTYVRCAEMSPADVEHILAGYVSTFSDLPRPPASSMGPKWVTGGAAQPKRIVITHPEDAPFERIADCAARIAAMLYRSDIRWTSISNGREADVPNGVSIRLFAENSIGPSDAPDGVRRLDDVPEGEAEIARELFGAGPAEKKPERVLDWRERFGANAPTATASEPAPPARAPTDGQRPSWEGRDYGPLAGRQQPASDGSEEVTRFWEGRSEKPPAEDAGDIQVDISDEEAAPIANGSPGGSMQGSVAAPATPVPMEAVHGDGARPGAVEARPAIVESRPAPAMSTPMPPARMTPAPVTPQPMTPAAVMPAAVAPSAVAPAPVMSAPSAPPPVMPAPPEVPLRLLKETVVMKKAPPAAAVSPPSPAADWEPSPNFRRPTAPMLRWTLMAMGAAGVVLAILYFVFSDEPQSLPGASSASSAEQMPSGQPTAPEPSAPPPAASTAGRPLPSTATPSATPRSPASSNADTPTKGGKPPKGPKTNKSKDPFDAPLQLGK